MPHPRSGDDQDTQQERAATRASAPRPDPTLSATASPGSKTSKHAVCRAAGCAKGKARGGLTSLGERPVI